MKEKNIILIRYSLWFLGNGLACALWASDKMWALSAPLFALSSLLLYKKRDFTAEVKIKSIIISIFIIATLLTATLLGWNKLMNNKWEHFVYRPHVVTLFWLAITTFGVFILIKELREYKNKIEIHNKSNTANR